MRTLKHPSRLLIMLAVAACASSACASSGGGGGSEGSPRRDANLITRDELDDVSDRSVLEVIQVLRPQWLRRTGFRNGLPSAVLDNQRYELDILETMTPLSFLSFRDRLDTASGLQSVQFRILEFRLGFKRARILESIGDEVPLRDELAAAFEARALQDALHGFLSRSGCDIPAEVLDRDVREAITGNDAVQEELLRMYRDKPDFSVMLELLTDLDEGLQEWRYRHVKLAERTIGTKIGTGGSDGIDFLKKTLFQPLFPDLWAIRSRM